MRREHSLFMEWLLASRKYIYISEVTTVLGFSRTFVVKIDQEYANSGQTTTAGEKLQRPTCVARMGLAATDKNDNQITGKYCIESHPQFTVDVVQYIIQGTRESWHSIRFHSCRPIRVTFVGITASLTALHLG